MMRRLGASLASLLVLAACAEGSKTPVPNGGIETGGSAGASSTGGRGGTAGGGGKAGSGAKAGEGGASGQSDAGAGGANAGTGGTDVGGSAGNAGKSGSNAGSAGQTAGAAGAGAAGEAGSTGTAGSSGAGGAASAGAAGGGGSAGGGGVGPAGTGGAAGSGGAAPGGFGGQQAGGGAGASGNAGGAGASGNAGSAGASGNAGTAGAGGSPATGPALIAVALSVSGQLLPARYESFTWKPGVASESAVGRPAVAAAGTQALVAFRTPGGALRSATVGSSLALVAADVAPVAKNGPFLGATMAGARVAFTDNADLLLTALYTPGTGFGSVTALTSNAAPSTSLATPTVASTGATEGSVHAGKDEGVYFAPVGGLTEPVVGAGSKTAIAPVLVYDATGRPVIFYVRNSDSQVFVTVRKSPGSWSAPVTVAPNAFTDRSPFAARLTNGDLVVTWHGQTNQGIYLARSTDAETGWGTAKIVQEAAEIASSPVVVASPGGVADLLFVRAGVAQHARLEGGTLSVGAAFGTGLSEVGAAFVTP